jgi:hypothetical protein
MRLTWPRHWAAWLLGGLAVSALTSSMTAKGATLEACVMGEYLQMVDPVVTVINGPGDPVSEQLRWSLSRLSSLEGPLKITLGDTGFELERVP